MKNNIPRIPLAQLPTPFYKLENISAELGRSIYIKRDDMTGVSLGGNKVRKLEYLLADAKEKGCDVVITTGGAQSNHAMLGEITPAMARAVGQSLARRVLIPFETCNNIVVGAEGMSVSALLKKAVEAVAALAVEETLAK